MTRRRSSAQIDLFSAPPPERWHYRLWTEQAMRDQQQDVETCMGLWWTWAYVLTDREVEQRGAAQTRRERNAAAPPPQRHGVRAAFDRVARTEHVRLLSRRPAC
jgi:hypothetical protein